MAEVLGVVASGIAVSTLAGQVAGSIIKLKGYWNQVRDAPSDIQHLLRELDSFELILSHVQETQNLQTNGTSVGSRFLQQSLQLCQDGANELRDLVDDLAEKIDGKAGWRRKAGSLKVVLKQDDLKKIKRRMKSAIRLLSLSYQCHTNAMMHLQPQIIVDRVTEYIDSSRTITCIQDESELTTSEEVKDSPSKALVASYYASWVSSTPWMVSLLGSFYYARKSRKRKGRTVEQIDAVYRSPSWLSSTTFRCQSSSTLSGWNLNCYTYRTLNFLSPYFVAIGDGDVATVRRMLTEKTAFITDRDPFAYNGLHLAAFRNQLEMCKFLLEAGVDPLAVNDLRDPPLQSLLFRKRSYWDDLDPGRDDMDVCRLLLATDAATSLHDGTLDVLKYASCFPSTYKYIRDQIYPPYFSHPCEARMEIAAATMSANYDEAPALFDLALSANGAITYEMISWADADGNTMLHYLIDALFSIHWFGHIWIDDDFIFDHSHVVADAWSIRILSFVAAGAQVSKLNYDGRSPFGEFCYTASVNGVYLKRGLKLMQCDLTRWVTCLFNAGVNVEQYGIYEEANRDWNSVTYVYLFGSQEERYHSSDTPPILGFSHGPTPSDWSFWLRETSDEFAGHFWGWVDAPVTSDFEILTAQAIPGAWRDE